MDRIFYPNPLTIIRRAAGPIAAAAIVCGLSGLLAEPASAATRQLSLYNTHTFERLTITYKRNGKYLPSAVRELNRFLRDWRRNEITKMDLQLLDLVWTVYQESGSQQPIHVVSGYRSPATNNMLRRRSRGVAKFSRHMRGQAMDFFLPDVPVSKLRALGLREGIGGVGYYPSSRTPFVHMDTGRVRHWPRMTRKQLVRVFPRGKTLHVPRDGKPLTGYASALAKRKSRRRGAKILVASAKPPAQTTKATPSKTVAPPSRVIRVDSLPVSDRGRAFAGVIPVPRQNPFNQSRQLRTLAAIPRPKPSDLSGSALGRIITASLGNIEVQPDDPFAATIRGAGFDIGGSPTPNLLAYARSNIPNENFGRSGDGARSRKLSRESYRVAARTPATMVDAVADAGMPAVQRRQPFAMVQDPLARLGGFDFRISARLFDPNMPAQSSSFAPMPQAEYLQYAALLSKTEMAVDGLYTGGNSLPPRSEYIASASYGAIATSVLPRPIKISMAQSTTHPFYSFAWYGLAGVLMMVFGGFIWSMRRLFA